MTDVDRLKKLDPRKEKSAVPKGITDFLVSNTRGDAYEIWSYSQDSILIMRGINP